MRGARLAFIGYASSRAITFFTYAALARLVSPSDFGRYAAASVIVGVGGLFAESGMMSALIRRPDRIEEAASSAFFSLLIGGTLLSLAALAVSPAMGLLFSREHVVALTAALAPGMLVRSMMVVPDALLQRRFSFARRVAVDPLGSIAFAVGSIVSCANGAGAWGLVIGFHASQLTQAISGWAFARFRPRRRLASFAMWRELAAFARHVLASEVLSRTATQIDAVMLGRFAGAAPLGQYRNGLRLAQQPSDAVIGVGAYVLLPALARLADHPRRLSSAARNVLRVISTAMIPISLSLLVLGEQAAILLLGRRWSAAGHVIAALFAFVWSASIISVCSEVFKAVNRPQNLVRMHSVSLITLAAFVSLGAITIGAVGVAGAVSLSYALTASYALYLALPSIQLRFRDWFMDAAAPLAAAAAMAGAMFAFSLAVDPLHQPLVGAWALTAAEAVLGAGVYLTALAAIDPGRRDAARSYLRRGRGEKSALMRAG